MPLFNMLNPVLRRNERLRTQREVACGVCVRRFLIWRSNSPVYGIPTAYLKDLYSMKKADERNWKELQEADGEQLVTV
jgi:hypothetical protein